MGEPTCAERAIATIRKDVTVNELRKALPQHMDPERFARLAVTMYRRPTLAKCDPDSLLAVAFEAAQLGLYLDGHLQHAHIVPFKHYDKETRKTRVLAQLMVGYPGYILLAQNSGKVISIQPVVVYDGDDFYCQRGTSPRIDHVPDHNPDTRGNLCAVYSVLTYRNGHQTFEVMPRVELMAIRKKYSKKGREGEEYGAWVEHFPAMCMKTVLKRHLKYAGLSAEITAQVMAEERWEDDKATPREDRQAFLDHMQTGQTIEPVESESAPVAESPNSKGLTAEERQKFVREHIALSKKLNRKRPTFEALMEMADNTLVDAVEMLRQQVAEQRKPENRPTEAVGEESPFLE